MSQRAQNSARGSGGLGPAGLALDTFLTFASSTPKQIETISWSYGANGGTLPAAAQLPLLGRLVVLDGVAFDPSAFLVSTPNGCLATGIATGQSVSGVDTATVLGILSQGGVMKFDADLTAGGAVPLYGQFLFPADNSDGALVCVSGAMTIALFAPKRTDTGAQASNVVGKLTVQFKELVTGSGVAPDYTYKRVSSPLFIS